MRRPPAGKAVGAQHVDEGLGSPRPSIFSARSKAMQAAFDPAVLSFSEANYDTLGLEREERS